MLERSLAPSNMGKSPVRTGGGHAAAKVVLPAVAIAIGVHSGPAVLATLCAGFLWNLLYVRYFAPLYDRKARLKFVALSWCRDIIVVAVRYFIVCNGHHGSPLAWLFLVIASLESCFTLALPHYNPIGVLL